MLDRHGIVAAAARAALQAGAGVAPDAGGQTTGRADKSPAPAPARGPVVPARCVLMAIAAPRASPGPGPSAMLTGPAEVAAVALARARRPAAAIMRPAGRPRAASFRALLAATAPLWQQSSR